MFERFTDRARKVMALANFAAHERASSHIEPTDILLGLVRERTGVAANVLTSMGVDLKFLEEIALAGHSTRPAAEGEGNLPQTGMTHNVISVAIEEAKALKHNYVGTEHLLLGLLRVGDTRVTEIFRLRGVELAPARQSVLLLLGSGELEALSKAQPRPKRPPRSLDRVASVRWWITDVLRNPGKSLTRWQRLKLRLARWLLS